MNNPRRDRIRKAVNLLDAARSLFEEVASEEREAFENLPESLQMAERGERMSAAADTLDEVASALEDLVGQAEEAAE